MKVEVVGVTQVEMRNKQYIWPTVFSFSLVLSLKKCLCISCTYGI